MRSVHFRVEDDVYMRIQEEAEQQDLSVAAFARVATIARALLWGVRRGAPWADVEAWGEALDIIQEVEHRDIAARAKVATDRRTGRIARPGRNMRQPAGWPDLSTLFEDLLEAREVFVVGPAHGARDHGCGDASRARGFAAVAERHQRGGVAASDHM